MNYDVCIIGAGPAGLMAALEAASAGARVVVLEKNSTAARKLLCTGRGRCNVTHHADVDELVKAYGQKNGRFLRHSLHEFSAEDICNFFMQYGLEMKVEKDGCIFPLTNRASDIKRILDDRVRRNGVEFIYGTDVEFIEKRGVGFLVGSSKVRIECGLVIIATGGMSWPGTGSTGDGYKFARELGHEIVEPRAALVPLVTDDELVQGLQGVTAPDVRVTVEVDGKKISCRGPMMFTDNGIGGPVVFNLSRFITDELSNGPMEVYLDFAPAYNSQQVEEELILRCTEHPKKEIAWILLDMLPRALGIAICRMIDPRSNIRTNQLPRDKRSELIQLLKECKLTIKSTRPIKDAIVTKGGVAVDQIEGTTMESKVCSGLFFAGEVIDVDGPCGGYNLQIAWSTGVLAGRSAGRYRQL